MNTNRAAAVTTGKAGMNADRKAALWIHVLYIIGTVAMVRSLVVTNTGGTWARPTWPRSPRSRGRGRPAPPCGGALARDGPSRILAGREAVQRDTGHGVRRVPWRARVGSLHHGRVLFTAADRTQHRAELGRSAASCARPRPSDVASADRHPVRSRRADVLRRALPVAARPAVAVHVGLVGVSTSWRRWEACSSSRCRLLHGSTGPR